MCPNLSHRYSVLFECNNLELTKNRDVVTVLNDKLSKYVQHYIYLSMSEQDKLQTILNLKPLCKKEVEEDVHCMSIYLYLWESYDIVQ